MKTKVIVMSVASLCILISASGCGTVAGAAGSAIAGSAASGAIASNGNKNRFEKLSCEQLQQEIAGARRSMMNPASIPYARAYIKDAREVGAEKGCELES